jgi:hypothetical protein
MFLFLRGDKFKSKDLFLNIVVAQAFKPIGSSSGAGPHLTELEAEVTSVLTSYQQIRGVMKDYIGF